MNKRGQSIIEYALIAVLVILGIVYMGPYVLRSVNAHFKLWDDSVHDSFRETIKQAPVSNVPTINSTCVCKYDKISCGSSAAGSACPPGQMSYTLNCGSSPQGCSGQAANICQQDNSCCTQYSQDNCGKVPLPLVNGVPSVPVGTPCPGGGGLSGRCSPPLVNSPNDCYYGQRIWSTPCATFPIQCVNDSSCPLPQCLGAGSPGVIFCATGSATPPPPGSLTQDSSLNFVAGPLQCTTSSAVPCQVYCGSGYIIDPIHGNSCINGFKVAMAVDSYKQGNGPCAANGCHGAGQSCSAVQVSGDGTMKTVNTCNITMCAIVGTLVTGTSVSDVSSPMNYPYCGNPGNPGERCQITFQEKIK